MLYRYYNMQHVKRKEMYFAMSSPTSRVFCIAAIGYSRYLAMGIPFVHAPSDQSSENTV